MSADWTGHEKKVARRTFDQARQKLYARTIAEFKAKAAAIVEPVDLWTMADDLNERRRHIDQLLDYRYSQLTFVFARLIAEGYLAEQDLQDLAEEKRTEIKRTLQFLKAS